jgi:exodeoxyribonuclease VIII
MIVSEPFDAYARRDAVNCSLLKEMRRSPRRYLFRKANPLEDSKRLALGRAAHTAILEPDRFPLDFVVFPGARRAGKEWDAFAAANRDKTILKLDEYAACLSMRDAVRSHPVARDLLAQGQAEQTITWTDPETGLDCKARADWLGAIAFDDVKTTGDIDATRFGALATRMGYPMQMAFYREGLLQNGLDLDAKIIAVEADEPFDVAVFSVDDDALYAGEIEWRDGLRKVKQCQAEQRWPGRYEQEVTLILPPWAYPAEDEVDQGLDLLVTASEA